MIGVNGEGLCEGMLGVNQREEPLTLTICHNYMELLKGGSLSVAAFIM